MKVIVYFNSMIAAGGIERVITSHIYYMSASHKVTLLTKDDNSSFYGLPLGVNQESRLVVFIMYMN
jgi:hypothetical protein